MLKFLKKLNHIIGKVFPPESVQEIKNIGGLLEFGMRRIDEYRKEELLDFKLQFE